MYNVSTSKTWNIPHKGCTVVCCAQAHQIQETLNRRETLPTLPSRYPYKDAWKHTHSAKEVANVKKKRKKQSAWHTLPEMVIRKMWICAGKLEVPHSRSLQNVKVEHVPSALSQKQNCTLTSILQMHMHCSYFLSPANPERLQYRRHVPLSFHSPWEV